MKRAALAFLIPFALAGCASVDASRQDRCQKAEWAKVGERDGLDGQSTLGDKYEYICGDLFQRGPYEEGLKKGLARRPTPPA
jgi:hypothetical protein